MNCKKKLWNLFLLPLIAVLCGAVMGGCSDDDEELQQSQYGYVQFKLYKEASYAGDGTEEDAQASRASMDKLADAQKIEVEMQYEGTSITQTLVLNAYNESNAEYGMRSDKLQLVVGDYKIVGYRLLNKLDEVIVGVPADADNSFTIVAGGLTVKDLTVDSQPRGTVTFKLIKDGLTRAAGDEGYPFSSIALIDVTVTNTFTQVTHKFDKLKVTYEEGYEESVSEENPDDLYKKVATARCDSAVWLETGTYQVTSYTTYSKSGSRETVLETQTVRGESFVIEDNQLTKDAVVPIRLSETADYIKDYLALREIWEALDGKNWSYYGVVYPMGTNWNFNKELDMWGDQPGVSLDAEGRVVELTLSGFGINGYLPDAIGQLTELKILTLGSHDETVGGKLFSSEGITADMSEAHKQKMRRNYEELFLKHDVRENLSEMLQEEINSNPKQQRKIVKSSRITLKDTQVGAVTNKLTGVSKAVVRLTKLQQLYIANSPIPVENICTEYTDADDPSSPYYEFSQETGSRWNNLVDLTDVEVYNCKNMTRVPDFIYELPELQLLNIACNRGISAAQLKDDWTRLAEERTTGPKVQILYMGYNNLEEFPASESLQKMKKLVMIDLTDNKVRKVNAFGQDIKFTTVYLQNNQIESIPQNFCGFTNEMETFDFSNNRLTKIPNIFDANSVHIMGSVDFSNNQITGVEDPDNFKGINANEIALENNRIKNFPKELFSAGSPITTLNMSGNLLEEIPEGSLQGKNSYLLETFDLRFNKLTKLSEDFRATTIPYLSGLDLSYNCFSEVPADALNPSTLRAFAIRHQRDAEGNRTLRNWPEGITTCPSLYYLQIGSNDIRKVDEEMTPYIYILDIADNPNITIDLSGVCSAISQGLYYLYYDQTQDIRGCDILFE